VSKKVSVEELLAKANQPKKDAMELHPFYRGKIETALKAPVRDFNDFAIWYTPGVAEPCLHIKEDKNLSFEYTNRWNTIAIVTDGTRVLGLGNIGPEAGLPVMEGKAMLFKYLGGVDAFPLALDTKKKEDIIQAVKWLQPCIGGVNLEDIEKPKCYEILDTLKKELDIPVWHDDQQGTALVTVAGFVNALKVVGKKIGDVTIAMVGAGAANSNIMRYLGVAGVDLKKFIAVDSRGTLHAGRLDQVKNDPMKTWMCLETNGDGLVGGIEEAMKGADAVIAASRPGPGIIKQDWVANMADDAIVFAEANPIPEIWPWEAEAGGARVIATGRSDFKNQVNNSLGFPAVFRGALDVSASTITDEMCIAAAFAVAEYAEKKGINEDYIIPTMDETDMFIEESVAVALKAIEQGIARRKLSRAEIEARAAESIRRSKKVTKLMMKNIIPSRPTK
jgi:malate dehydrogenase (oxaloacetate-decarboxylating)